MDFYLILLPCVVFNFGNNDIQAAIFSRNISYGFGLTKVERGWAKPE